MSRENREYGVGERIEMVGEYREKEWREVVVMMGNEMGEELEGMVEGKGLNRD